MPLQFIIVAIIEWSYGTNCSLTIQPEKYNKDIITLPNYMYKCLKDQVKHQVLNFSIKLLIHNQSCKTGVPTCNGIFV